MKAKIIGFTKFPDGQDKDCEAITTTGEKIIIDPFVGCSWKYEERNHLLNEWVEDENAWENNGVWLTDKHSFRIINPMENIPTPHTDQFEEIRKEFDSFISQKHPGLKTGHPGSFYDICEFFIPKLHHIRRETEKGMIEKVKEFRHEHRDKPVSAVFDVVFDEFISNLESDNSTQK